MLKIRGLREVLVFKEWEYWCLFTSLFEDKYDNLVKKTNNQILAYHVNNTYAKLAPDSILNKKIKEIMRYTGDTGHPL